MESDLISQRSDLPHRVPQMSKLGQHNLGWGLKQHCVPKNYVQGQQQSRYYNYQTDDYGTKN